MLKNKLLYLFLFGYSIIFAILYNEYISGLIVFVIAGLPIALFILLLCTIPFISIEKMELIELVGKGDQIKVRYQVKNKSFLPVTNGVLYLTYRNSYAKKSSKKKIDIVIDCKSKEPVNCNLTVGHCGNVIVVCEAVRIYDYFKICSIKKKINVETVIAVLPELYDIESEFVSYTNAVLMDSDVFSKEKSGDDPSEVFNIREYQQGDKIRRIHWKLSSKREQLMVKEFSLPVNCAINILVELYFEGKEKDIYSYMDALIETVFSLSFYLIQSGHAHNIVWYDSARKECISVRVEEEEQIYQVIEELLKIRVCNNKQVFLETYDSKYGMDQVTDIFYITGTIFPENMERVANSNHKLHVMFIGSISDEVEIINCKVHEIEIKNVKESLKEVIF